MPATSIAGTATQALRRDGHHRGGRRLHQPCRRGRARRGRSAWRSRGRTSTATIAPAPMQASSSVKVPASPPCRPRASSGSSAEQRGRVQEEDRDAQQHRAQARRLAHELHADPHRAEEPLLPERVGPVLVAPAQDDEAREHRQHGVEREHPDAAGAGDERAGDQRPDDAREVHRHAVQGQRRRRAGCAAPARARSPRTPASAAPGRCRWRRPAPAAAARS